MNETHFVTLFNILNSSYEAWIFPTVAGVYFVIACLLPFLIEKNIIPKIEGRVACLLIVFFLVTLLHAFFTTRNFDTYRDKLKSGQTSYVEGFVTNLETHPKEESFCVNGVCFRYSDYSITEGFNHMSSHGGPIRQGLYVRIWYVGNVILKLEAKK